MALLCTFQCVPPNTYPHSRNDSAAIYMPMSRPIVFLCGNHTFMCAMYFQKCVLAIWMCCSVLQSFWINKPFCSCCVLHHWTPFYRGVIQYDCFSLIIADAFLLSACWLPVMLAKRTLILWRNPQRPSLSSNLVLQTAWKLFSTLNGSEKLSAWISTRTQTSILDYFAQWRYVEKNLCFCVYFDHMIIPAFG